MYGNRQLAYAPTPYVPRSALSATINLDEEVKLSSTSTERDLYDSLAEIYSIIITVDALEKAYLKDSITEDDYTETCSRLLKQYKSNLADETVARAFGDLETFKREWDMECPRATERLRVGIPITVEQGPTHPHNSQGDSADATLVVNATENFITLLDAIKIGLIEKDTLHPLLVEIIQAVNKVTDKEFESKGKIVQWLITLNQMRAAEKLDDEQAREFQFDMEQAYYGFKATGSDPYANTVPVLDLPQLYTKPSAEAILETLVLLTSAPPSWESNDAKNQEGSQYTQQAQVQRRAVHINPEGVTQYLTGIVSNDLRWIEDDEAKEKIWDQASARLSERSGRTAMGAMSRRFRIPSSTGSFELSIHEPTMLGDDLGLKTWAASYLLAKRLHTFKLVTAGSSERPRVLELGSGTGLVGLAMAGLGAEVVLTDLASIYPNLTRNVQDNSGVVQQTNGSALSGVLDWNTPTSLQVFPEGASNAEDGGVFISERFPLILAADSLYSPDHPRMLVESISAWLSLDKPSRVIVEFPYRVAYLPQIEDFRERMGKIGLHIVEEGEEKGYDDWGGSGENEDEDDRAVVTCWYSIWGREGRVLL
ncbi:VPS28-domain-containing protein [Pleomassaria siparia CBS 279.74]|uniref:VPS28-domain-containing protein n=1 Tax=Pleomassaria siparia CBS 279.74 TaxID=1314801 RepID=A0A6G1K343_9PLEO|nr:VPS28-domain-containing protein [Pleomassaria siparia CBS 279.74]